MLALCGLWKPLPNGCGPLELIQAQHLLEAARRQAGMKRPGKWPVQIGPNMKPFA